MRDSKTCHMFERGINRGIWDSGVGMFREFHVWHYSFPLICRGVPGTRTKVQCTRPSAEVETIGSNMHFGGWRSLIVKFAAWICVLEMFVRNKLHSFQPQLCSFARC